MSKRLIIFLMFVCIITFGILFHLVKRKKMLYKHALMWGFFDIILFILIFQVKYLRYVADFLGIEKVSNMIFLFAFFIVIAICLTLTLEVAKQKSKIVKLTQELGIINNKIGGEKS